MSAATTDSSPTPSSRPGRTAHVLAAGVIAVLWVNSVRQMPGPEMPTIPHVDKVLHYFYFGLIATMLYRLPRFQIARRGGILAVLATCAVGMADELLQTTSQYRTTDFVDGIFDFLGAVTAVLAYRYFTLYRKILEIRLW